MPVDNTTTKHQAIIKRTSKKERSKFCSREFDIRGRPEGGGFDHHMGGLEHVTTTL